MVNAYRRVALVEGVSYLLLLLIAMPLKYLFQIPEPVKYIGWAHGILFVLFIVLLVTCWVRYKWSFWRVTLFFLASLLPIVPFLLEKRLAREYGPLSNNSGDKSQTSTSLP